MLNEKLRNLLFAKFFFINSRRMIIFSLLNNIGIVVVRVHFGYWVYFCNMYGKIIVLSFGLLFFVLLLLLCWMILFFCPIIWVSNYYYCCCCVNCIADLFFFFNSVCCYDKIYLINILLKWQIVNWCFIWILYVWVIVYFSGFE